MNPLNYLLRPFYNKEFRMILDNHVRNDVSIALTLSTIPKLEMIGEAEWTDFMDDMLEELAKKYDPDGTCLYDVYPFVSKKLRQEYDTAHCLIRSFLEGQLYNYLPKNRFYEEDSD